jgi:hypothetical protein
VGVWVGQVVEHASVCLSRIAETFGSSSEKLDMLCAHGLIPQVARLISVSNSSASLVPQASLSSSTYTVRSLWGGGDGDGVGRTQSGIDFRGVGL